MPHKNVDFDAIASAIGFSLLASKMKKNPYIVVDDSPCSIDHGVQMIIDEAKKILKNRGITEEIIKEFRIGLAPSSIDDLHITLNNLNISELDQIELGLVNTNNNGKVYELCSLLSINIIKLLVLAEEHS